MRWLLAVVMGLAWLDTTAIGPVILVLTPEHGVHAGDVLALFPLAIVAAHKVASR